MSSHFAIPSGRRRWFSAFVSFGKLLFLSYWISVRNKILYHHSRVILYCVRQRIYSFVEVSASCYFAAGFLIINRNSIFYSEIYHDSRTRNYVSKLIDLETLTLTLMYGESFCRFKDLHLWCKINYLSFMNKLSDFSIKYIFLKLFQRWVSKDLFFQKICLWKWKII